MTALMEASGLGRSGIKSVFSVIACSSGTVRKLLPKLKTRVEHSKEVLTSDG